MKSLQRFRVALVVLSGLIVACGGSGSASGSVAPERPGATSGPAQTDEAAAPSNRAGPASRGPATATIMVDGATTTIAGGRCDVLPEGFLLTLGESGFYPMDPPQPDFFALTVEGAASDGHYTGLEVTVLAVVTEKDYEMDPTGTVTFRNNLTEGSFRGPLATSSDGTGGIEGTFDCGV